MDVNIIRAKAIPILRSYGVCRAFIFGSFARGEQNQDSDIDILVEYSAEAERSLFKAVELKYELEEILQKKVDVVTEQALSPYIRPYVMRDRRVIM